MKDSKSDAVVIADLQSLLDQIESSDLWVKWVVRCQIGPDWIGGGRLIQFYLDHRPLADTQLHHQLKDALVRVLNIPDASSDAVISGEGTVTYKHNTLEIEYEWSEAVPYMDAHNSGFGTAVLVTVR
ncbi:MAG: hypothetical protein ACTS2F_29620 [Thainema sp.]